MFVWVYSHFYFFFYFCNCMRVFTLVLLWWRLWQGFVYFFAFLFFSNNNNSKIVVISARIRAAQLWYQYLSASWRKAFNFRFDTFHQQTFVSVDCLIADTDCRGITSAVLLLVFGCLCGIIISVIIIAHHICPSSLQFNFVYFYYSAFSGNSLHQ